MSDRDAGENTRQMTLGESRVRISFNPSGNERVDQIKNVTAALIDLCNGMNDTHDDPEKGRCLSLAMTHYEDAAMWAVKGATAPITSRR